MEEEVKRRLDELEGKVQSAQSAQIAFQKQIKSQFLNDSPAKEGALWVQLKLIAGRKKTSTDADDYELVLEKSSSADERWRLDVNERYQRAVSTVVTLATLVLGAPFLFLKTLPSGKSLLNVLGLAVWGEVSLGISILCAVIYFFFSAKWVKLALVSNADFFWIPLRKRPVEVVLDLTYFFMMLGFLVGVFFIVQFMTTYVSG
jgi:hypothetical protein